MQHKWDLLYRKSYLKRKNKVYNSFIHFTHCTLLIQKKNQWSDMLQRFNLAAVCASGGFYKRRTVGHGDEQKSSLYNVSSELFWFSCPQKAAGPQSTGSVQAMVHGRDCAGSEIFEPEPQQRWWWKYSDVLQQQEDGWQMRTARPETAVETGNRSVTGGMEMPWRHHLSKRKKHPWNISSVHNNLPTVTIFHNPLILTIQ